jgi:hypothetical protein
MQHSLCTQTNTITTTWTADGVDYQLATSAQGIRLTVDGAVGHLNIEYDWQPALLLRHRHALRFVRQMSAAGAFNRLEQAAAA